MPDYIDRLKMPHKGIVPAPSQVDRLVARFGPRDETR
jgi:hypothetical protein